MFPVRNFISRATVWKGSIFIGASGGGVLMMFCATLTAAAQEDWSRRREGWYIEETFCGFREQIAALGCVQLETCLEDVVCRAKLATSPENRLVMDVYPQNRHWYRLCECN